MNAQLTTNTILLAKIVALIEQQGTTQAAVERACGLPVNRISKWYGWGYPDHHTLVRLARFLGASLDYLMDDSIPIDRGN
jgi:transcriptional regulator with XRE-family HTH domain